MFGDGVRQSFGQHRIDFDGGDGGAPVQQRERQRTEAGAHFQDVVGPTDPGGRHHSAHRVGVVDEILAERFPWPKLKFFGQPPDLRAPE
ncbi:hypothetical protein MINTM023_12850 [Mycobacterium intracellulare]|nr:hypothetical protein MINTM023_12850 [Mycobacterium intracellulare]BCP30403.1 hypothetical protein MINTM026_13730 [Mycobacterium intracellulare]